MSAWGTITRVAGTGAAGDSGDDGLATEATFQVPWGVALTADGGFLISDPGSSVVRKVSSTGTITRVAGTGIAGNSGDDGPATYAQLSQPVGVAVTADGGFLIADVASSVVRKVGRRGRSPAWPAPAPKVTAAMTGRRPTPNSPARRGWP